MKIAFTGTSSTGKTTLAKKLMSIPEFVEKVPLFITTDARELLRQLKFQNMDAMTREQTMQFQSLYFYQKLRAEDSLDSFLTDRSFVDVTAYWICRDTYDLSITEQHRLLDPCRQEASKYDIHFYFPPGLFQFESDGYRSNNMKFHMMIDRAIRGYLNAWSIRYIVMNSSSIDKRIEMVLNEIRKAEI